MVYGYVVSLIEERIQYLLVIQQQKNPAEFPDQISILRFRPIKRVKRGSAVYMESHGP